MKGREAGRVTLLITVALLQCRAHLAMGEKAAVLARLEAALWASTGGNIRRFLDEGKEICSLVEAHAIENQNMEEYDAVECEKPRAGLRGAGNR
jgi:hypothetical protein